MDSTCASPQPKPQMLGLAVVSLVLSSLSVFLGPFGVLLALLGVACGHSARRIIRKDPEFCGGGVALAGLIVGYTILIAIVIVLFYVFLPMVVDMLEIRYL
jgi:hypothetical protein